MKLLILGGSNTQLNAILKAKLMGHVVIVSDYYENAPGKEFCDYKELISTFDALGNIKIGQKYGIDGILTLGTDQPVYTVAKVAETLELPSFIDTATAKAVTNKKIMKKIFTENNIPTAKYKLIKEAFVDEDLRELTFPVVIKPIDSQGQRGVFKLNSIREIRELFKEVRNYSREEEILVEEYYKNDEITVSGWVENDKVHILTVTDRVTYDNFPHIGVCIAHDFPTKHFDSHYEEIEKLTLNIVKCFNIHNGPIYFQMLIGDEGIKVNEIACRIGGAYEDEFIPRITGVDILELLIASSLGKEVDYSALRAYNIRLNKSKLSVEMLFSKPGYVEALCDMEAVKRLSGVLNAKFNIKPSYNAVEIENATQRAGYMIVEGSNQLELSENIKRAYKEIKIYDNRGKNLLIKFKNRKGF